MLKENNIDFYLRVKGVFDDILYTAHILAVANKISYVKIPVYNYRIIGNSITHSYKPNVLEINSAIFASWREFFSKYNVEECMKPFYACVLRRIEESIRLYYVNSKNEKSKKELLREYNQMLDSEPYHAAIRQVDLKKLPKKQKLLALVGRIGMNGVIWRIYRKG